jgi:hypothetical protein
MPLATLYAPVAALDTPMAVAPVFDAALEAPNADALAAVACAEYPVAVVSVSLALLFAPSAVLSVLLAFAWNPVATLKAAVALASFPSAVLSVPVADACGPHAVPLAPAFAPSTELLESAQANCACAEGGSATAAMAAITSPKALALAAHRARNFPNMLMTRPEKRFKKRG